MSVEVPDAESESEIAVGVAETDILHHGSHQIKVQGDQALFHFGNPIINPFLKSHICIDNI